MKLKVIAIFALMFAPAFAGKVITYTATSQQSQEEANNAAMAGVAKQVSAQVKVNQTLSKEEVTKGTESNLSETYKSDSKVLSDIKIKGISVKPEPAAKGFKATATLDMDEFTADIQFKMKSLQLEITQFEETARESIKNRQYKAAISAIESSRPLIKKYELLVQELGKVYPIDDSHRLKQNIKPLESELISRLSGIRIEGPGQAFTLTKPEMPVFSVTVSDKEGYLASFPLVAKQGRTVLSENLTQESGSTSFNLKGINIDRGPFVVVIEPGLPEFYKEASGLHKKLEIDFKATQSRCTVNIKCELSQNICSNLERNLAKKNIFIDQGATTKLDLRVNTKAGTPIEYVPGKFTTPYDIDISLKSPNITFMASSHENGKQPSDAMAAAMKKINFDKLKKQLEPYCK